MKKLVVILGFCLFCATQVSAEEVSANQEISIEANKAVISLQKQPTDEKSTQKQEVKNNWFCVVVQVNGKIKNTVDAAR